MAELDYLHVDVFSSAPFSGNSLTVFPDSADLEADEMLRITQEMRHFESIFLSPPVGERTVSARVFDLAEELPFAGHPLLGAAAVLQHRAAPGGAGIWQIDLSGRVVSVTVEPTAHGYRARLDQGRPQPFAPVTGRSVFAHAYALDSDDLHSHLPLEIGDTGLRYLVVPLVRGAIGKARIVSDITGLLRDAGAQFGVLFDPEAMEIRHWNNDGVIEDIATGSAAGVVAAYALRHGLIAPDTAVALRQGRFTGRPSSITVWADGRPEDVGAISVGGDVAMVGAGTLWHRPGASAAA
ncbi:MAG TPA: PhzF family phenazine biosynthesis protein [Sphingomonas sp.]|nr:PhzF family phenazine biosynthesis protein [Sphingomonas sp.]